MSGRESVALWTLTACGIAAAIVHAYTLFWTCDDAFISFRYADHLIEGKGLRYNEVERVEGYSNFLWVILIAIARFLTDVDAAVLGNWLGLAFGAGTLLLLVRATRKLGGPAVPIAAIGLAAHYHFAVFASCGLETSMIAFLITALVCNLIEAKSTKCYVVAGLIGTMIAMTRADGPLIYGLAGLYVLAMSIRAKTWRPFLGILLPGVILWIPYFVCRWIYYGDPMANVFYAKSVSRPYAGQGWLYVRLFFQCYWVLIPAIVGVLWLSFRRGPLQRPAAIVATITVPFTLFVMYIGGDFMFARYLIPITPALYLGLELLGRSLPGKTPKLIMWLVAGGGTMLMLYPTEQITKLPSPIGIGEERLIYTPEFTEASRQWGQSLAQYTEGADAALAIGGAQAGVAYYSRFKLVIECAGGLTDEFIARQPLKERKMVGHERHAPIEYLYRRGVNLMLNPPHVMGFDHPFDKILRSLKAGKEELTIVTWSTPLMKVIREKTGGAAQFTDVEIFLDDYFTKAHGKPKEQLRADLQYFRDFYFAHNDDPDRLQQFEDLAR